MTSAVMEHINLTVADPSALARRFCRLFGWEIRWQGQAMGKGFSVHVGGDRTYLALYQPFGGAPATNCVSYENQGCLNHIGVMVDDLEAVEEKARKQGYELYSFGDYEPGRRFYLQLADALEVEVVSYQPPKGVPHNPPKSASWADQPAGALMAMIK